MTEINKISSKNPSIKFVCPYDNEIPVRLKKTGKESFYECKECHRHFPIINGIVNFLPDGLREWITIQNNRTNKKVQESNDFSGKWKPGFRGWRPNWFVKLLSIGSGEGRITSSHRGIVLDVGCGDIAKGDVNTDIYIPSQIPNNFVLATAELLPFMDNSFDIVRSAYVIEHNLYPTEMIKEHFRVCKKRVEIFTDNSDWLGIYVYRVLNAGSIFHDEHYFKWSKEYFGNILNRLNIKGKVKVFNTSPSLLVKFLSLFGVLPRIGVAFYRDLYVEIYKK